MVRESESILNLSWPHKTTLKMSWFVLIAFQCSVVNGFYFRRLPTTILALQSRDVNSDQPGIKTDLMTQAKVAMVFKDITVPFIAPNGSNFIHIDEKVQFKSDLIVQRGQREYIDLVTSWADGVKIQCPDVSCSIVKSSYLVSDAKLSVQWNVTFVPKAVTGIAGIARILPGFRVVFFDLLKKERERSLFSWTKLVNFFWKAIATGEVSLPHAVILGSSEFTFRKNESRMDGGDNHWTLVEHKESLNLIRSIKSGVMKNRKLATDLLEYLDAVQPRGIGVNEWNDIIVEGINLQSVPGMRQFDIDGLEGDQQEGLLRVSTNILGYATLIVLLFGLCSAIVVFNRVMFFRDVTEAMSNIPDMMYF